MEKLVNTETWKFLSDFFDSIQKKSYENYLYAKNDAESDTLRTQAKAIQELKLMVMSIISEGKWCADKLDQHQNYKPKELSEK